MPYPPVSKFKYSNLGAALLAHALERAAGQPYQEYVLEHICRPLGMTSTCFTPPTELADRTAIGYRRSGEQWTVAPLTDLGIMAPAGQMWSTAGDLAHFLSLQFRTAGDSPVLRNHSLRQMWTEVVIKPGWREAVGLGWHIVPVANYSTVGHSGGISGFTANIRFVPELKLGLVLLANLGPGAGENIEQQTNELLHVLLVEVRRMQARQTLRRGRELAPGWQKFLGRYQAAGLDYILEIRIEQGRLIGEFVGLPAEEKMILHPLRDSVFRLEGGTVYDGELLQFAAETEGRVPYLDTSGFRYQKL